MEESEVKEDATQKSPVAFFLLPVDILRGIHEELSDLLGTEVASKVLYNCGVRSGRNIVNEMNINFPDLKTLCNTLPELWLQMGMGVFTIDKLNEKEMVLKCIESNEAEAMGFTGKNTCDLTSGYLAGMVSRIFNKEFQCIEKKCMSNGAPYCVFELHEVE
jgi:predicted hydrocarbon binding protein